MTDPPRFSAELSGLRGFAALGVVVYHAFTMIPFGGFQSPDELPIDISNGELLVQQAFISLFNGRGFVILFFVLSGCVLSLSMQKHDQFRLRSIAAYWIKRGFRLYPLLILSATIAALLHLYYFDGSGIIGASNWANSQYVMPDENVPREWLVNAIGHSSNLNTPAWSISVELIGSLIFPLIYFMACRTYTSVIAISIALAAMFLFPFNPKNIYFMNLYAFSFVIGALIPQYGPRLVARFNMLGSSIKTVMMAIIIVTFLFARAFIAPDDAKSPTVILVESICAGLIITLLPHRASASLLRNRIAQELGRISYGVYLFHLPVLFVVAKALLPALAPTGMIEQLIAFTAMLMIGLAITLLLSHLVHVLFEFKLQELGRKIGNHVDQYLSSKEDVGPLTAPLR